MDKKYEISIHGLLIDDTYDWDEMERKGWRYSGPIKLKDELVELWKTVDHKAIADESGRILRII